jgi:aminopeptidase-like protein
MSANELTLLEEYFDRLWPLHRSLTGKGVRDTISILKEIIPLESLEVASGTKIFDWTIPQEWVVDEAYFIGPDGKKYCDIKENNLHLINYSEGFERTLSYEELEPHLLTLPDSPEAIPYFTSYYSKRWAFCLKHNEKKQLPKGDYQVVIKTKFIEGSLTLSGCLLPGKSKEEILFSTYTCHPSLANNELSGPLAAAFLFNRLKEKKDRYYTYRFIFLPETIGSLTYLHLVAPYLKQNLKAGYVITCCGDKGDLTYKESKQQDSFTNRAAKQVLKHLVPNKHTVVPFFPWGSDERQYCSPGINLPVGSLMRTMYGKYPEYHTSLDNKDLIDFKCLQDTISTYESICSLIESNTSYIRTNPNGEPHLQQYNLYSSLGGKATLQDKQKELFWLLNYCDGNHDLLDIAERSDCGFFELKDIASLLVKHNLLEENSTKKELKETPTPSLFKESVNSFIKELKMTEKTWVQA